MINRVFTYSKKEAKKNRISFPILQLVMSVLFLIFGTAISVDQDSGTTGITFTFLISCFLLIFYSVLGGIRLRDKFKAYATTNDGSIYQIVSLNNVQGISRIGNRLPNSLDSVRDVANIAGAASQIIGVKRVTDLMQNPNFIAESLENYHYVRGMLFTKIDRVYSINKTRKHYIIDCDYTVLNSGKEFKNKKIKIARAYTGVDDLANLLEGLK